jgi:uncharacterized membrane protein (DUF373 family)
MAQPLVPSPVLREARPHKVLAALLRHRRLEAALAAAPALARVTRRVLVPAPAAVAGPVAVVALALVLATLLALVPAISPAEAVGTSFRIGGD